MLTMVHDRIATQVTTVVSTAAVLQCKKKKWKNYPHSWIVSFQNFRETRRYYKLKEEALDRTMWRTRCGRGYGPVVRETAE